MALEEEWVVLRRCRGNRDERNWNDLDFWPASSPGLGGDSTG